MSSQREADRQLVETIKAELAVSVARFLECTSKAMRELANEDHELTKFWNDGAEAIEDINHSEEWG